MTHGPGSFNLNNAILLPSCFLNSSVQLTLELPPCSRHEPRARREQSIHLLQRELLVSGMNAQKKMAFVKLQTTKTRKYLQPISAMAGAVTCPISVLNANEVITPIEIPFERVLVSKTSAGMIQDREPQVNEKLTW